MIRARRPLRSQQSGFSLPEVLVSSALLAMVVVNSSQVYLQSGQTLNRSSLRDASYALIAEDLDNLRRETWRWACESGSGCTGQAADADQPVAYKTGRSGSDVIASYRQACGFASNGSRTPQTLASLMLSEVQLSQPALFPTPAIQDAPSLLLLPWSKEDEAPPVHSHFVTIQRTLEVNADDANQLDVSYSTTENSKIKVELKASLTPEALAWCP